jgi:hypothetical protein
MLALAPAAGADSVTALSWVQLSPASSPPARNGASMAYDAGSGQLVLFGGDGTTALNDTWTWTGSGWMPQTVTDSPSARSDAAMAYDPASGQLVLFGGLSGSSPLGDTWVWNGSTWAQASTSGPPASFADSMAYDAGTGQLVLFTGDGDDLSGYGDTWVWSGSSWNQVASSGPSDRNSAMMAYDPGTGQLVLFGGQAADYAFDDTWLWNGTSWTEASTSGATARYNASLAYDSGTGQLLLFGGEGGTALSDTWTWSGTGWVKQSPADSPSARSGASMAYDAGPGQLILFGGQSSNDTNLNDTWVWEPQTTTVAPRNTSPPSISGSTKAGKVLTCSTGTWTGAPTSYGYEWLLDGTPISNAAARTLKLASIDEGNTLTCTVIARNTAGSASATSKRVKIPVPRVPKCPPATGSQHSTTLGLVKLGMTRSQAEHAYTRSSTRGRTYQQFFCLTPIGVRVGYASPKVLKAVPPRTRSKYTNRIIWISTSSAYYAVHGIRAGATVTAAKKVLKLGKVFVVGANDWYLAPDRGITAIFKVRHSVIEEIGIADAQLTSSRAAQATFLTSFQ